MKKRMIEMLVKMMHEYADWNEDFDTLRSDLQDCCNDVCWDTVNEAEEDEDLSCNQAMRRLAVDGLTEQGADTDTILRAMSFDYDLYYWAFEAIYSEAIEKFLSEGL